VSEGNREVAETQIIREALKRHVTDLRAELSSKLRHIEGSFWMQQVAMSSPFEAWCRRSQKATGLEVEEQVALYAEELLASVRGIRQARAVRVERSDTPPDHSPSPVPSPKEPSV
jgi:hypothetical protein